MHDWLIIEAEPVSSTDRSLEALKNGSYMMLKIRWYSWCLVFWPMSTQKKSNLHIEEKHYNNIPINKKTSSPIIDERILPRTPSIKGFLNLTESYWILSNDASWDANDDYWMCYEAEAMQDLMSTLFGADTVKNYVGNFWSLGKLLDLKCMLVIFMYARWLWPLFRH
jgi:hypothetical protein